MDEASKMTILSHLPEAQPTKIGTQLTVQQSQNEDFYY